MASGQQTIKVRFTGEASGLKRAARAAEKAVEGVNKGILGKLSNLASGIPDVLGKVVGSLPPMGQLVAGAIGAGLAVALGPIIGAAITSAVLLAVGGGVLALGIKSAIDNPNVAKAFSGLKAKATKIWDGFGKPFEQPLIRAAGTIGKVLDSLKPQIEKLGRTIAPVIDKLAPALGEFLKQMMPGIQSAVEGAVPLFNVLAEKLPGIGKAISSFFTSISENSDDAAVFFGDLLEFISAVIIGLGKLIGWLADFYVAVRESVYKSAEAFLEFSVSVMKSLGRILDGAVIALGWLPGVGPKLKAAQEKFRVFQEGVNKELKKIKDRNVKVQAYSNVGSIVVDAARQLRSLRDREIQIRAKSNVGYVVANAIADLNKLPGVVNTGKKSGKRANGGPVMAGSSYLVGERGPEILTMGNQSGRVTPNHEIAGPETLELVLHLGEGITERLKVHDRSIVRMVRQMGGRA